MPIDPPDRKPLDILWSPMARKRLREIRAHVARDKPIAAERLAIRIVAVVEALRTHPYMGRAGAETGTRELIIGGTPYIVVYRVHRDRIAISTVLHAAQQRPEKWSAAPLISKLPHVALRC